LHLQPPILPFFRARPLRSDAAPAPIALRTPRTLLLRCGHIATESPDPLTRACQSAYCSTDSDEWGKAVRQAFRYHPCDRQNSVRRNECAMAREAPP
jgi:hypothetical protein